MTRFTAFSKAKMRQRSNGYFPHWNSCSSQRNVSLTANKLWRAEVEHVHRCGGGLKVLQTLIGVVDDVGVQLHPVVDAPAACSTYVNVQRVTSLRTRQSKHVGASTDT